LVGGGLVRRGGGGTASESGSYTKGVVRLDDQMD
jgi:hypothetical protein